MTDETNEIDARTPTDAPPKPPSQREWTKADTIAPVLSERMPPEVSDGGGLGFEVAALGAALEPLDPSDPCVFALLDQIETSANGPQTRLPWRPRHTDAEAVAEMLDGWRLLADHGTRRLYGKGVPPRLVTVTLERGRRDKWRVLVLSVARQIRASIGQRPCPSRTCRYGTS